MTAEGTFAGIVDRLSPQADVSLGSAMHTPGLQVRGRTFAMLVRDELVVKLPAARLRELLAAGTGRQFAIGPRAMPEWAVVGEDHDGEWLGLAREALGFARR